MNLKQKFCKLFTDEVTRNSLILAAGSAFAKLIGILAMPILARQYDPKAFGNYSIVFATIMILAPIATLRFSTAIPLPKRDTIAATVALISFTHAILFSLVLCLVLFFTNLDSFSSQSLQVIGEFGYLIVAGIFLLGLNEILSFWGTRKKQFKDLSKSTAIQAIIGNCIKLILGATNPTAGSLIIGTIAQSTSGSIYLIRQYANDISRQTLQFEKKLIHKILKRYSNYFYLKLPGYIFFILSLQAPMFFVNEIYGVEFSGQFALTLMSLNIPLMLLIQSTSKAYFGEISSYKKNELDRILALTYHTIIKMAALACLPCLVIALFGPALFTLIFGDEWQLSGEFARIMSAALFFQFLVSPIMSALDVINRQNTSLKLHASRLTIVCLTFYSSYAWNLNIEQCILAYSLVLSIHYVLTTTVIIRRLKI